MSTIDPLPPSPQPPPTWTTPPTEAGTITVPPKRPVWPTVLGIIAIAYACISLLGIPCSALFILQPSTLPFASDMPAYPDWYRYWSIGLFSVTAVLAVVLLVGGVRLVGRHAGSIPLCKKWAIAYLVTSAVSVAVSLLVELDRNLGPDGQPAGSPGVPSSEMMATITVVTSALTLLLACVLPVFMLIWFGRPKVKAEVAQWAEGDPSRDPAGP